MDSLFAPLPVERRDAAQRAISTAFGSARVSGLQQIFGGASALVYRIDVDNRPYLLRLDTRTALRDPARGYACMKAAAEAGLAPRVHLADSESNVAIMDFVMQRPLTEYPNGQTALVRDLGKLIAKLQSLPVFPVLGNYLGMIEQMLGYIRAAGMFATGLLDPHAEILARIRKAYPWEDSSLVSSHNDPNPRNILFDGERLWLIDWETAFRNDPITDTAILANNFAASSELEDVLLRSWLGRDPDHGVRARLTVMRAVTSLYYASIILIGFTRVPRKSPDADLQALSEAEFRSDVAKGQLKPGSPELMYALGKMLLAGFMARADAPGFQEALAIIAT